MREKPMFDRLKMRSSALVMVVLASLGLSRCDRPAPLDMAAFDALYSDPALASTGPQRVFFVGHSLVGRDMPAMLTQLSGADMAGYESQLGWGASMKSHWEPDVPVNGFEVENAHPRYRDAREAVASGDYDVLVLTEMVEIRDAIKYFDSGDYLHRFARAAWEANPQTRVYFYETWHPLSDPDGWLERVDQDLARYWEGEIMRRAAAFDGMDRPIYLIPAGQVMAQLVREVEAGQGAPGLTSRTDLFSDDIHLTDQGLYLVALVHYAVIHQRAPIGLPHALVRADGTPADAPDPQAAALMQRVVWDVVRMIPRAGLPEAD
jgi:hypothetical protein